MLPNSTFSHPALIARLLPVWHLAGLVTIPALSAYASWGGWSSGGGHDRLLPLLAGLAYGAALWLFTRLLRFPLRSVAEVAASCVTPPFLALAPLVARGFESPYILVFAYLFSVFWLGVGGYLRTLSALAPAWLRPAVPIATEGQIPIELRAALSPWYRALKRLTDIVLVLLSLPLTLPIMLLVSLAIRLDSPGPVLFWQTRIGQGEKPFTLVKFRSMRVGLEETRFAERDDARVTRVGRVIRRFHIDELPQFWNVLRGEMSLIGPRPEQPQFAAQFAETIPLYRQRHLVKPGITGWAQVMGGYAASVEETRIKLEYDLYYLVHGSPLLDFLIIVATVRTVLSGSGAR